MTLGLLAYTGLSLSFKENKEKFYTIIAIVPIIIVLILSESRAAWISLGAGYSVFLITSKRSIKIFTSLSKVKVSFIFTSVLFSFFLILILLYKLAPDSVDGRKLILKITTSKITEKPLFGYGLFNFAGEYNEAKAIYFLSSNKEWEEIKTADYVTLAFNDYAQLAFELGVTGILLLILFLISIFYKTEVNIHTRIGFSLLTSLLILALFTSVVDNPSAMIIGTWALACILFFGKKNKLISINISFITKFIMSLVLLFSLYGLIWNIKKTKALADYKKMVDMRREIKRPLSLKRLLLLDQYISDDPYMEFTIGEELYMNHNPSRGLYYMTRAVNKNNSPMLNNILSLIYEHKGEIHKTEELLKKNTGIEPFKFKPRINLMDFYGRTGKFKEQKETSQAIIDLPVKIPSKEVDEYKKRAKEVISKTQ